MRLDRFTQHAPRGHRGLPGAAQTYNHSQIEPEHLLLALLQQPEGVVPEILMQVGANPQVVQSQLEASWPGGPRSTAATPSPA